MWSTRYFDEQNFDELIVTIDFIGETLRQKSLAGKTSLDELLAIHQICQIFPCTVETFPLYSYVIKLF